MRLFTILFLAWSAMAVPAGEVWRFLLLADWHQAEKYTQRGRKPDGFDDAVAQDAQGELRR